MSEDYFLAVSEDLECRRSCMDACATEAMIAWEETRYDDDDDPPKSIREQSDLIHWDRVE